MIYVRNITVVSLGYTADELTLGGADMLQSGRPVMLRTRRHPIAAWLSERGVAFASLDALYSQHSDFSALAEALARAVLDFAESADGSCVYAVMDALSDESVHRLKEMLPRDGYALRILPGVSPAGRVAGFTRPGAMTICPASLLTSSINNTRNNTRLNPDAGLLITELNDRITSSEVKLKLMSLYNADMEITLFDASDASEPTTIRLYELDRQQGYDHTTCAYIPPSPMLDRVKRDFHDLLAVMERLRDPDNGCPWDVKQTHKSLREYILEEACEVIEAIDLGDADKLVDELGDSLLQVVFHSQVGKQRGEFDILDVTSGICEKLIRRHPHIFGAVDVTHNADPVGQVLTNWEAIKKNEKKLTTQADVMRDIPLQLTALMRASKVQKKARAVGFDWDSPMDALGKVYEELGEVKEALEADNDDKADKVSDELGDLLFAVVNVSRLAGVQPELALMAATRKFIDRFSRTEAAIMADGLDMRGMTLDEMDKYWNAVKGRE